MADSHLGHSTYTRVTEEGLNQREVDVRDAFSQAIDIAIHERVDTVVHAGDLFDSIRPTNRILDFAIGEVRRLTSHGIPFIVISGNHETPKMRETGSVFRILEHFGGVYPVYAGYKPVTIDNVKFHCIPHLPAGDREEVFAHIRPDASADFNVMVTHGAYERISDSRWEANEMLITGHDIGSGFDYVALGHYHKHYKLREGDTWIVYPGSTERFSFAEAGQQKGVVIVDLKTGEIDFKELTIRPMYRFVCDCTRLTPSEVIEKVRDMLTGIHIDDALVRVDLRHISRTGYLESLRDLNALGERALIFRVMALDFVDHRGAITSLVESGSIEMHFEEYMKRVPLDGLDRKRLIDLGLEFLRKAGVMERNSEG